MTAGLTGEEEVSWVQQVFKESTKEQIEKLGDDESIRKLLKAPDVKEYGEYRFADDLVIRHKKYPSTNVRNLLSKSRKIVSAAEDPTRAQDSIIYRVIADLCIDPPFNDPVTWAKVDAGTNDGRVFKIFMDLMKKVGGGEQSLQSFR